MLKYFVVGAVAGTLALMAYVRFAPLNGARWHAVELPTGQEGEVDDEGRFTVVRRTREVTETLTRLDVIIRATPHTQRVAGRVEDHKITYVTRSGFFGFPDYTTVMAGPPDDIRGATDGNLTIFGRLRFGKADLGVNRTRIKGWLAQLDEGTPTP